MKNTDLQLDQATRETLLSLLSPLMGSENERRALLSLALNNESIYQQIDFDGPADTFTINMINKLVYFGELTSGEQALFALLSIVKTKVGGKKQKDIEDLISHIRAKSKPHSKPLLASSRLRLILLMSLTLLLFVSFIWYIISNRAFVWRSDGDNPLIPSLSSPTGQPISHEQGLATPQATLDCQPTRICIVVANISPETNEIARDITKAIYAEIDSALEKLDPPQPIVLATSSVTSSYEAEQLALQKGAILVIWGTIIESFNELTIQFEVVDRLGIGESADIRVERVEPILYAPVHHREKCTDCLSGVIQRAKIVAYTAVGLTEYVQGRPEQARSNFLAALYCAGEEIDIALINMFPSLKSDCANSVKQPDWTPDLLYYYLGKSLILQGDYEPGIVYLQKAADFNVDDPAALISISDAYQGWLDKPGALLVTQNLNKAEERIQKSIETSPPIIMRGSLQYDWGVIRELQNDTADAQQHYEAAARLFDAGKVSTYASLVSLGRMQRVAGDYDAAQQTLEKASQLVPTSPWAYLELARRYENDREQAEKMLDQAEQARPNEAYVYIVRAELCSERWQDYDCAENAYNQALNLRPQSGWLHSRIGDFYLPTNPVVQGQSWELAEDHYTQAVELRPKDPWVHERLAYVLFHLERFAEAVAQYEQAIRLAYQGDVPGRLYCNLEMAQRELGLLPEADKNRELCLTLSATPNN